MTISQTIPLNPRPSVANTLATYLDPTLFARCRLDFHPDPAQASVLASRAPAGILNCTRQWGKSTVTSALAVYRAFTRPASLVLVLSPSARQSAEFIRKAAAFLRRLSIRARGDGDNDNSLLLPNSSRIIGLPGRESTVRGFSAVDLLLIDEAARVPDELYHAVRPMLATSRPGAQLWLLSTPNGRRGFFFEEWSRPRSDWFRLAVPATGCPRITPTFLARERVALGDLMFRQEYLCEFLDNGSSLFSAADLKPLADPAISPLFPHLNSPLTELPRCRPELFPTYSPRL